MPNDSLIRPHLAAGDALGVWCELEFHMPLVVVLHRDGPFTWRADRGGDGSFPKVAAFYSRAL